MESASPFPFRKLRYSKYLILEVMMYEDHYSACEFMFAISKEARIFIQNNFITVKNGFINEGLVVFNFDSSYDSENLQFNNYE